MIMAARISLWSVQHSPRHSQNKCVEYNDVQKVLESEQLGTAKAASTLSKAPSSAAGTDEVLGVAELDG